MAGVCIPLGTIGEPLWNYCGAGKLKWGEWWAPVGVPIGDMGTGLLGWIDAVSDLAYRSCLRTT